MERPIGHSVFVNDWKLLIKAHDEWEECTFSTQRDAVMSLDALAADYMLQGAILLPVSVLQGLRERELPPLRVN